MKKDLFYVLAHNIRSLYNVGSIFRTADGAGVDKVILTGYSGTPLRKEVQKVALGAEDFVLWEKRIQACSQLAKYSKQGFQIIALENNIAGAKDYRLFKPKFPLLAIVGNEVTGIASPLLKRVDQIVSLPMRGKKKSLNVACAFAIFAYYIAAWRDKIAKRQRVR